MSFSRLTVLASLLLSCLAAPAARGQSVGLRAADVGPLYVPPSLPASAWVLAPWRTATMHGPRRIAAPPMAGREAVVIGQVILGLLGGAGGAVLGGAIGYEIATVDGCEHDTWFCGLGGIVIGGVVGETVGLATGVHLGNAARGHYVRTVFAAAATTVTGFLVAVAIDEPAVLLAVPLAQLVVAIRFDRRYADERR